MQKQIIESKVVQYLELKNIKITKKGQIFIIDCPICNAEQLCIKIPNIYKWHCHKCNLKYDIFDFAKKLENNFPEVEEERIHYLKQLLNINITTSIDEGNIDKILNFYKENNFDLVPIVKNQKIPAEKEWTSKNHKDIDEWKKWILDDGINIGVKTGIISGVTIVDIDQKPIPEEIKKVMGNTLMQESTNGFHLFYKYEEEIPKTRIDEYKMDLENDGGQVVIAPSKINNIERKITLNPIIEMPKELKNLIMSKITVPRKTISEDIRESIETENFKIDPTKFNLKNNNLEGSCNSEFIKLGGILRKQLNINQTSYVVHVLNKHMLTNPMDNKSVNAMLKELDRYDSFDEKELAHNIIDYLKNVEESTRNEIAMAVVGTNRGEDKKKVDKALFYLLKEEYLTKKGNVYSIIKKADWRTELIETGKPVDFKVPYFDGVGNFRQGDLLLVGSKNKMGKTHISVNILKQLVNQGKTPYYISLETGSRFAQIALKLGLKEGDFKWCFLSDPTKIELEKKSITIIDWLCPTNFAETDKLFMHFVDQLYKTEGFLIVFMQLKENNEYFAPNLIKQFPTMACRYIYDNESDGEYGKFVIDAIRDPKMKLKGYELPCKYNWESKELSLIEDLQKEENE